MAAAAHPCQRPISPGLGASKRVVFFDTLLKKLSHGEVRAVLAHELGHFKHKHVLKRMVMMFAMSLAGFALLGWLSRQVWFYQGLGVNPNLQGAPTTRWHCCCSCWPCPRSCSLLSPIFAYFSRRDEYQADAYACQQAAREDLANALIKLYGDNSATLTPDPIYVRFHYSHPASRAPGRHGRVVNPLPHMKRQQRTAPGGKARKLKQNWKPDSWSPRTDVTAWWNNLMGAA